MDYSRLTDKNDERLHEGRVESNWRQDTSSAYPLSCHRTSFTAKDCDVDSTIGIKFGSVRMKMLVQRETMFAMKDPQKLLEAALREHIATGCPGAMLEISAPSLAFAFYWPAGNATITGTLNMVGADRPALMDSVIQALKHLRSAR